VEAIVDAGLRQHVERSAARGGADRVAVERIRSPYDLGARALARIEHGQDFRAACDRGERKAAAHGLAIAGQVGLDAVFFLRAAPGNAKAGDDLVEHEHDAVLLRHFSNRLEKSGLREQYSLQRLDDHGGKLFRMALDHVDGTRGLVERRNENRFTGLARHADGVWLRARILRRRLRNSAP
jgi:hypothetical protein